MNLPRQFGRYLIERQLGEGGMGVVFLARDPKLNRLVALKVPRFATDGHNDRRILRFEREARLAASISHPNICPVFDVGDFDGVRYFTMPFIEGVSLSDRIKATPVWPPDAAKELVLKLARALDAMHRQGLVHRDIKPENVLLKDGVEPILMDFGLSRSYVTDDVLTRSGSTLGTPAYMSPEQVRGHSAKIGPPTDIWSLGVLLYELVTGRRPFLAQYPTVFLEIMEHDPDPPSAIRPSLGVTFDGACLGALEKEIELRIPMEEFIEQLTTTKVTSRSRKSVQVPAKTKATAVGITIDTHDFVKQETKSVAWPTDTAAGQGKEFFTSKLPAPVAFGELGNVGPGEVCFSRDNKRLMIASTRRPGFVYFTELSRLGGEARYVPFAHEIGGEKVPKMALSAEGTQLATHVRGEREIQVRWLPDFSPCPFRLPVHDFDHVRSMSFSPTGHLLAVMYSQGGLRFYSMLDGSEMSILSAPKLQPVGGITAFSPDGRVLAAEFSGSTEQGEMQTMVYLIIPGTARHLACLTGFGRDEIVSVTFAPDNSWVAVVSTNGHMQTLRVWRLPGGEPLAWRSGCGEKFVAASPDGSEIWFATSRLINIYKAHTLEKQAEISWDGSSDPGRTLVALSVTCNAKRTGAGAVLTGVSQNGAIATWGMAHLEREWRLESVSLTLDG